MKFPGFAPSLFVGIKRNPPLTKIPRMISFIVELDSIKLNEEFDMKHFWKIAKEIVVLTGLSIIIGYFLLVLVHLIPPHLIQKNIQQTAQIMKQEGNSPSIYAKRSFLENFSDADAFAVTFNQKQKNIFINALEDFNYYLGERGNNRGVEALWETVQGNTKNLKTYQHSQEWNGFQIYLKPLLIFYDISDIRYLCFLATQFLMLLVCLGISRAKQHFWSFLPFFFAYEYFAFSLESMSVLLNTDICVMLLGCLGILWAQNKHPIWTERIFISIGIFASYFSMFNMPMITIGFPLVLWLSLSENKVSPEATRIKKALLYTACWLGGYAFMTFFKLFMAKLLLQESSGTFALAWYTGIISKVSLLDRCQQLLSKITEIFYWGKIRYTLLVLLILTCLTLNISTKKFIRTDLEKILLYLGVAYIPIVWIFILIIHAQMPWTIFLFSISIYAILEGLWNIFLRKSN